MYRVHKIVNTYIWVNTHGGEDSDGVGPTAVVDFMEIVGPDERELVMRDAFEVVNILVGKLGG